MTGSPARLAVATERPRMIITEPTPISPSGPTAPFHSGPTAAFQSPGLTRAVDDLEGDPTGLALDALSVDDALPSDDESWTFDLQSSTASDASSDGGQDDSLVRFGELASNAKEKVLAFLSPKPSPGRERTVESLAAAGLVGAAAARPTTAARDVATYLRIENRTGCPLMLARWPTKLKGKKGDARFRLSNYRAPSASPSQGEETDVDQAATTLTSPRCRPTTSGSWPKTSSSPRPSDATC